MDYLAEAIVFTIDALIFGIYMKYFCNCKRNLRMINNAPSFEINKDLKNMVDIHPEKKMYVILYGGLVEPVGKPITSINNNEISGAIQLLKICQYILQRKTFGFWVEHEKIIQKAYNVMPFLLTYNGYSVEVIDPLAADILDMDVISDTFTPPVKSTMNYIWEFICGIKLDGVQATEKMLRKDAKITAIGELVVSKSENSLILQPPSDGSPFYLTNKQINVIIKKLYDEKNRYKYMLYIFGTIGIVIAGFVIYRIYNDYKKRLDFIKSKNELEKRRLERRRQVRDSNLPESQLCVVCKINPKEIIILPCGHICLCEDCSLNVHDNCPVCHSLIERKSAAYIS